jgi:hypothetical protein
MTFNPSIPTGGQTIASTTSPIQTNFSVANTAFGVDHTAFSVALNQGFHKQVTLATENVPGMTPSDPLSIIFTQNNLAGHPYPFFLNSQTSVANALPFLPDLVTSGTNYGFKLGNLIFLFGTATILATQGHVVFAPAIAYTTGLSIVACSGIANPPAGYTFGAYFAAGGNLAVSNTPAAGGSGNVCNYFAVCQ